MSTWHAILPWPESFVVGVVLGCAAGYALGGWAWWLVFGRHVDWHPRRRRNPDAAARLRRSVRADASPSATLGRPDLPGAHVIFHDRSVRTGTPSSADTARCVIPRAAMAPAASTRAMSRVRGT